MIVVDDLRWDEFSIAGHPYLKTPNIDRLVQEGVLFENAYHVTPLSSPNRASILTGQYPSKHGIIDNVARDMASHQLNLFSIELQKVGYETAHIGKWHMGNDPTPRPGYDYWVSFPGQGRINDPILYEKSQLDTVPGYITDILTDRAIDFIHKEREKPFFLYFGHKAVHPETNQLDDGSVDISYESGFIPSPKYNGKYKGANFEKRKNSFNSYDQIDTSSVTGMLLAIKNSSDINRQFGNTMDHFTSQETIQKRAEMILSVDESLGRILKELEDDNILENTFILFTSDNGYFFGEHGLSVERRLPYEESVKSPLLVMYSPLAKRNTRQKEFILSIDYAPTILDLAGGKIGSNIQGRSIIPLLKSEKISWRKSFLMECYSFENPFPWLINSDYKALRNERYKYIHWVKHPDKNELYDLIIDPLEQHNLFFNKTYKKTITQMEKELAIEIAKSIGLYYQ
jgi:N-acetylglucosamine-6-sulfatase